MKSNPLSPIWESYQFTKDSLTIIKRAVKTKNPIERQRLLQRTHVFEQRPEVFDVDDFVKIVKVEVKELFVVSLWATFERFLRNYLQQKGVLLTGITPIDLGEAVYNHFLAEVEYWKPDEILDFLKPNLLQHNPQLAGAAKAIYHYRSWIVHGKNEDSRQKVSSFSPEKAYATLSDIIQILLASLSDESTFSAIFEQGVFRPLTAYNTQVEGQQVQLVIIQEQQDAPNLSA
jgi:hypothetical protein